MDIINAYDALLSPNDDLRDQANEFLINQIDINQNLYGILYEIYSNSHNDTHKKLSVILIKYIVKRKFDVIQQNFQDFTNILLNFIENSTDIFILKLLADIICRISLNLYKITPDTIWDDYQNYLTLYKTQQGLLPFCIYLFLSSICDQDLFLKYEEILNEIRPEIILLGLQHNSIEVKLDATLIFCKMAKKFVDENFLDIYLEHYNIICQIAQESMELNENNFNLFWIYLLKIDTKITSPLCEIAYELLSNESLSPSSRSVLFQHILQNEELIDPGDLEDIISSYFSLQCELDDVDNTSSIFLHLVRIDEEASYTLFKTYIVEYLNSENLKMEYVGLNMLQGLLFVYPKLFAKDVSELLSVSLEAATSSEDNIYKALEFLKSYLHSDQLNFEDSMLAIDFLISVIVECTDPNIQYQALQVCENMNINAFFFEKLIDIYENIQQESLAIYLSLLLNTHTAESNITMDRYEPFLQFLIAIFDESCQKVSELVEEGDELQQDNELLETLYNYVLIRGTASNLILYLSFYNPVQLGEYVEPTIDCFMSLLAIEDTIDFGDSGLYNLNNVKEDFVSIFYIFKEPGIEFIRKYYDEITDSDNLDGLQHLMCSMYGPECVSSAYFIDEFEEEYENLMTKRCVNHEEISMTFMRVIDPLSRWIYKFPDDENNHHLHVEFLHYVSNFFMLSYSSYDIFNHTTKILLRVVKPKRIEYNSDNEWYKNLCKNVLLVAAKAIRELIPKFDRILLPRYFPGFVNLVLIFAYLNHHAGHQFLMKFVIPFYKGNQECSEIQLLDLFSKMIGLNFYVDEEIDVMLSIVNDIIERGKIYHDPKANLFNLLTDLAKIRPEIAAPYIELALELFNDIKDSQFQSIPKFHYARFLLSSFNQNPEELHELIQWIPEILSVFPVSEKHQTEQFWLEMKTFIEIFKDNMTREIFAAILESLARYLSYQSFTPIIFYVPIEQNDEIIRLFGDLIKDYCTEVPDASLKDILDNILPHQPTSIDFILSLYCEE